MLNLRSVNLNLLAFFEAIYIEKNLTAAAERVCVSQPAMSNALTRLRDTFNDDLFTRVGNQMEPTPRAKRLAPNILDALAKVRDSLEDCRDFDINSPRTFTLAGVDHVDLAAIPELVQRNAGNLGSLRFNSIYCGFKDSENRLKSGQVDIFIDVNLPVSDELRLTKLYEHFLVPAVRLDHPLAGKPVDFDTFCELNHVIFSSPSSGMLADITGFIKNYGLEEKIVVRVSQASALIKTLHCSDLVGFVPMAEGSPLFEVLTPLQVEMPVKISAAHYMIWHYSQSDDPGHRWLREQLGDIYSDKSMFQIGPGSARSESN